MQQHGSKYFARRPPTHPTPWPCGWGNRSKFFFFQNIVMLDIKRKGVAKCSNMVANILPAEPAPPPRHKRKVSKGLNLNLSEHGHDANQIKGNHKCSNMVANILPVDPPPTLGMGLIGQNSIFQNMVMLHIKLNGITKCSNMVANILHADPPPLPTTLGGWGKKVTIQLFQNMVMSHIKLKGITKCSNMVANSLPADPSRH